MYFYLLDLGGESLETLTDDFTNKQKKEHDVLPSWIV